MIAASAAEKINVLFLAIDDLNTPPVDGVSVRPLPRGQPIAERLIFWHDPLYPAANRFPAIPVSGTDRMVWRAVPATMVMHGDLMLTYYDEDGSEKLYDHDNDANEWNNLVTPDLAAEHKDDIGTLRRHIPALNALQREG